MAPVAYLRIRSCIQSGAVLAQTLVFEKQEKHEPGVLDVYHPLGLIPEHPVQPNEPDPEVPPAVGVLQDLTKAVDHVVQCPAVPLETKITLQRAIDAAQATFTSLAHLEISTGMMKESHKPHPEHLVLLYNRAIPGRFDNHHVLYAHLANEDQATFTAEELSEFTGIFFRRPVQSS